MKTFLSYEDLSRAVAELNGDATLDVRAIGLQDLKDYKWTQRALDGVIESAYGFFSIVYRVCTLKTPWVEMTWGQPMIEQEGGHVGLIMDMANNLLLRLVPEPGNISRGIAGGPFVLGATVQVSAGNLRKSQEQGKPIPFLGGGSDPLATANVKIPAPGDGGRENKCNTLFAKKMSSDEIESTLALLPEAARAQYVLVNQHVAFESMQQGTGSIHLREVLALLHLL